MDDAFGNALPVIPEHPSRINGQSSRSCRITLPIARSGDAGRRVLEMRPPFHGLADAPPAGSARPSLGSEQRAEHAQDSEDNGRHKRKPHPEIITIDDPTLPSRRHEVNSIKDYGFSGRTGMVGAKPAGIITIRCRKSIHPLIDERARIDDL